jgi:hypothetical protein
MDVNNNLPVAVDGDQAIIGTDVYSSGGQTAHAQVMKVAWGDNLTVNRATTSTPLPVQVYGITGTSSALTVTGSVRGLGTFTVGNTAGSPIYVTGGVVSYIQGITGSIPVAVTGGVNILSSIGITGTVNVTGGRYLAAATDTVTVTGSIGRSWYLSNGTDNVKVYASDGGLTLPIKIIGSDGTPIGNSGGALNVNMVNAGISANITIGSTINVQNAAGTVLRIEGTANGTPIPVSGTVNLGSSDINITNQLLPIDIPPTVISYNGNNWPQNKGTNIEKLFAFYENNLAYSIPWFLKQLNDVFGATGAIGKRITELTTNGSQNTSNSFVGVRTLNSVNTRVRTFRTTLNSNSGTQISPFALDTIKYGVTIKNISTQNIILGNGVQVGSSPFFTPPTSTDDYGIVLTPQESIFIPASISGSLIVADGLPPLYGKIDSTTANITGQVAVMAV